MKRVGNECIAVCAAISYRHGIEHIMYFENSVNKERFATFLEELRYKNPGRKLAIYMDQLSVHKCRFIRDKLNELSIPYIIGPIALPDGNPIEMVFNVAK